MNIKFEVGKYYRTVFGRKVLIIAVNGLEPTPIVGIIPGECNADWKIDGTHLQNNNYSIISEWIDKPSPPWAEVPKWFNWFAVDHNGRHFYYDSLPTISYANWNSSKGVILEVRLDHRIPVTCDWKDSLVERPTV